MTIDPGRCYDALRSRDPRFDGRFWVGVRTTGIYCRPVCPSRTPLAANVEFFAHPAAAEESGFRPCLRCRPDSLPGSDAWRGSPALVARALRLIDEGALDDAGVTRLAARLHVGERHLRRLFREHLGTSPDAVARSRRVHLARKLLVDTDLRVADVAFAAGFGSVRQCNDVVRSTFRATPLQVRAAARGASDASGADRSATVSVHLAARAPFDAVQTLSWLGPRAITGLEEVTERSYRRVVRHGAERGSIEVWPTPDGVRLTVDLPADARLADLVARTRRLFDLHADPVAVDRHLGADPALAPLVAARPGLRVPGVWSGFEAAVRAVAGQQISVAAARTVLGRVVARFGEGAFPDPDQLVEVDLTAVGLTSARAATVRAVASAVLDGALVVDGSVDVDELVAQLVAIPGVGPWTAQYVALRMGEPDAFPAEDLHLRRALGVSGARAALARAERWRPWRSYAALHLWSSDERLEP